MKKILVIILICSVISLCNNFIVMAQKSDTNKFNFSGIKAEQIKVKKIIKLTDDNKFYSHPKWSPDGRLIACTQPKGKGIWVIDSVTKDKIELTNEERSGRKFSWDKDGKGISYITNKGEKKKLTVPSVHSIKELPTISIKGVLIQEDNKIFLIDEKNKKVLIAPWGRQPEFLNDGRIKYQISDENLFIVFDGVKREVYEKIIAYKGKEETVESFSESWSVTCSSDGEFIIYADLKDDGHKYISSELRIKRIGEKISHKLLEIPNVIPDMPDWSLDGRKIVFIDEKEGNLYYIELSIEK